MKSMNEYFTCSFWYIFLLLSDYHNTIFMTILTGSHALFLSHLEFWTFSMHCKNKPKYSDMFRIKKM